MGRGFSSEDPKTAHTWVGGWQLHGFQSSRGMVHIVSLVVEDLLFQLFFQLSCLLGPSLLALLCLILVGLFLLASGFALEFFPPCVLMTGGNVRVFRGSGLDRFSLCL